MHEYRHCGLTCLVEAGSGLVVFMVESRHERPENVRKYFHLSVEAVAEVISLLASEGSRR
ncbi:hypothetical protein [Nocardiopsis xinjiangensis]|uniref:hypothetical protein n=1 Tax=Nocardiopsis xinjiangensis TaxID=124285 RepID=UPI0019D32B5B|nr:hypothetical protein [Nocardiopsis xinjiangensis]